MADDKKNKKKHQKIEEREVETVPEADQVPQEPERGPCGEVGTATAAQQIKLLWHEEHHVLQNIGDSHNPRKQQWIKRVGAPSLKRYARQLAISGDQTAKDFFANKRGAMNKERTPENISRIALEKQATASSRKKKSQGKSSKSAESPATIVTKKA